MPHLPPEPAEKGAHQKLGIEPVGLAAAMLARHRNAARVDHIGLDGTRLEPARQPEAVTAGFIGQRNTRDRAAGFDRLAAPALQQRKQRVRIGIELLARLTLQSRNKAGYQPAR